jgi:Holliday junction DNA helicase RuvA
MIGSLRGQLLEYTANQLLLEVSGVGYRVLVPGSVLALLKTGEELFLYIHDHIREDLHDLYGFLANADLQLFEQLLSISGVGPKVAMTILGIGSADTVRRAIMSGDLDLLTSVPGVGKKTAQKIVLELKGQLVELSESSPTDQEVIQALQGLGYSIAQAREVVKQLSPDLVSTSDRIREALRWLAKS